jgi:hypothetical protein
MRPSGSAARSIGIPAENNFLSAQRRVLYANGNRGVVFSVTGTLDGNR